MATKKVADIITCDLCSEEIARRPGQAHITVRTSVPYFQNGTRKEHLIVQGSNKEKDLCETCARGTGIWTLLYPEQIVFPKQEPVEAG